MGTYTYVCVRLDSCIAINHQIILSRQVHNTQRKTGGTKMPLFANVVACFVLFIIYVTVGGAQSLHLLRQLRQDLEEVTDNSVVRNLRKAHGNIYMRHKSRTTLGIVCSCDEPGRTERRHPC